MPNDEQKQADPRSENSSNELADLYSNKTENTLYKSPLVGSSYRSPYNPDDLWQKHGDYRVYEDMVNDDQVSVCLRLKKDLVLGDGGSFVPGEDGQDEIIEDLEAAFFEDYEGDFVSDLEEVLTSYEFGFSITEKIFKLREGGNLGLKKLKTRHPNSWRLYQDVKGSIEKYEQVTVNGNLDINPKSITHFINDPRFQNVYGNSDLRAAYSAYFAKTQIVRYFAIFLEKAASPIPVGRFDKNAPQAAVDKLFEILKRFQTKTAITIPKDIEVEFLEAKNNGDVYAKAIHLFNMFIGRALFIPDLVGFTGSETGGGSLALGKEQMNLFFMHVLRRRAALEAVINKELVWPQVIYNFGFVKNYPKFRFKPIDDMKAVELAKVWLDAVKGEVWTPNEEEVNHFRKLVKFPQGDVDISVQPPAESAGVAPDENGNCPFGTRLDPRSGKCISTGRGVGGASPQGGGGEKGTPGEKGMDEDMEDSKTEDTEEKNVPGKPDKKSNFAKIYSYPEGDYYKKVNFKAIETKLNDYDASAMNEIKPVVKKMIRDLKDQIERKRILQTQNTQRIDTLSLKYKKELKQILKDSFVQIFKDAKAQAAAEINKSANFAKAVASDKFLEIIEDETFKFVGDYEYAILKRVRIEIIAAIKDGKSLANIQDILDRDLNQMSEVQIERFARTKHTEVLNAGRVEFFTDSEVVAGYQYSAILDDVTTSICAGLNGKKFEAGDEPVPPLHFNCRSILIPITKYEEFKPTESIRGQTVDSFIEDNKGEGFSKFDYEEPKKVIEIKPEDADSIEQKAIDSKTDVFIYSKDGAPFYKVTVSYDDEEKTITNLIKPQRILDASGN